MHSAHYINRLFTYLLTLVNEEMVGGRERVTTDEKRVLLGG